MIGLGIFALIATIAFASLVVITDSALRWWDAFETYRREM